MTDELISVLLVVTEVKSKLSLWTTEEDHGTFRLTAGQCQVTWSCYRPIFTIWFVCLKSDRQKLYPITIECLLNESDLRSISSGISGCQVCIVLASNFDHRTLGELMSWGNLSAFYIVKQYLRSHILQNVPLASPEMKAVQPLPDFIVTLITEAHLLAPPVLKRAVLEISCLRCSQVFRPPSFVAAVFLFSLLKHVEGQTKRQF